MLAFDEIQCVRETGHLPAPPEYVPMPLGPKNLHTLRGILYSLEHDKILSEAVRHEYVEGLRRCIADVENGNLQSPMWWAAGALHASMRKLPSGIYIVTDRVLNTWALDKIFEFFKGEQH